MKQNNFCDNESCRRKFGLVVQRWFGYRFCCTACKEDFLAKLSAQRERMRQWLSYLGST